MTLDTDKLGSLYLPFQAPDAQTIWNSSGGQATLFVSQESLYKLMNPALQSGAISDVTGPITDSDLLASIKGFTDTVVAQLQSTDPMANALTEWNNNIQAGGSAEVLTVKSNLRHDYGSGTYDYASVVSSFVYFSGPAATPGGPPVSLALLMQHVINVYWQSEDDTPYQTLLNYGSDTGTAADKLTSVLELFGEAAAEVIPGLDVIAAIGVACDVVAKVGSTYAYLADDGGQLNFLGVLAHTLVRVASCVTPHSTPAAEMPVLQPAKFNAAWYGVNNNDVPGQAGVFFGSYPGPTYTYGGNTQGTIYNQPYIVDMPELSWSQGALPFVFVTAKVYSDSKAIEDQYNEQNLADEKMYALVSLVCTPVGNMVSATVECTNLTGTLVPTNPLWLSSSTPAQINPSFASCVENAVASTKALSVPSNQLTFVLPGIASQIVNAMIMAKDSDYNWPAGAQPLMNAQFTWYTPTDLQNDGNSSSVAVQPDGSVVCCFDRQDSGVMSNVSNVYALCGTLDGNSVKWSSGYTSKEYDDGTWPAIATNTSGNNGILDIHNGDHGDLYWDTGTVNTSGPTISMSSKSNDFVKNADKPAVDVGTDGVVIIFYAVGNVGAPQTYYLIGSFNGTTLDVNAGPFLYALTPPVNLYPNNSSDDSVNSDYPAVVRNGNGVLEVHNSEQHLYFNFGKLSGDKKSITWNPGPFPLMQAGSNPDLTYCGNGLVVLTYDNAGKLYAAIGHLDDNGIQWYITGLSYGDGGLPGVCAVPNNQKVVMSYLKGGELYSVVGIFTTPS